MNPVITLPASRGSCHLPQVRVDCNDSLTQGDVKTMFPEIRRSVFIQIISLLFAGLVLSGCSGNQTMQKAGVFLDDSVITTKVRAKLVDADDVKAIDISVSTVRGVVQLAGFVKTDAERKRAEEIARTTAGVTKVSNKIELK